MERMSFYQNIYGYAINPLLCPQYYPLYNYCYPAIYENNYTYSRHSSPFYHETEQIKPPQTYHLATESQNPRYIGPELRRRESGGGQEKVVKTQMNCKLVGKGQADQKENRNVYSNILRNFFRKLNGQTNIDRLVERIIAKNGLKVRKEQFYEHVRRLKVNHCKYLRYKKLRPCFVDAKQPDFAFILRVLFEHSVEGELVMQTLTSRKIGRWSVCLHLRGARELKQRLYH